LTPATPKRKTRARLSTRLVTLIALAFGLVLAMLLLFSHRELYQIYRLRQEKSRLDTENHQLSEENLRLARTIDRLHHDSEMIQDLIRRELNYVKKSEIIIQLPPSNKEPVKAALIPDRVSSKAKGRADQKRPRQRPRQASSTQRTPP